MADTSRATTPPGAEVEGSQSEQLFQALERFIDNVETSELALRMIQANCQSATEVPWK